ncbi:MAG: hypothetical protein ACK4IY_02945, partial [Chitinophagales bacterium]
NPYFSLGAEPGYVGRGAACVPGFTTFEADTKFYLHYVELPMLAKGKCPLFKNKMELSGKLGYGVAMLVAAYSVEEDIFGDLPPAKMKLPLGENAILNRLDNGFYGGFAIGVNMMGSSQIAAHFDYYYGMYDAEVDNTSKNRSFNIGVGYIIQL